MKVFNKIRLGLFMAIVLMVGWNEYSSSIEDQRAKDGVVNVDKKQELQIDAQAYRQDSLTFNR